MVSFISFILLTMKLPFGILLQIEWESSVSWKEWNILHKIIVCWFVEWVQNTFVSMNGLSSVKLVQVQQLHRTTTTRWIMGKTFWPENEISTVCCTLGEFLYYISTEQTMRIGIVWELRLSKILDNINNN